MALPTLPPEPMVQGRSMRIATAEDAAIFAIFLDRCSVRSSVMLVARIRLGVQRFVFALVLDRCSNELNVIVRGLFDSGVQRGHAWPQVCFCDLP